MLKAMRYSLASLVVCYTGFSFAESSALQAGDLVQIQAVAKDFLRDSPVEGVSSTKALFAATAAASEPDPVVDYETYLPNLAKSPVPKIESELLKKYLQKPSDAQLAEVLAVYHLLYIENNKFIRAEKIDSLKHYIYAQYFLYRAKTLGVRAGWVDRAIAVNNTALDKLLPTATGRLDFTEGVPAHKTFLEAFNYTESNRYKAEDAILKHLLDNPRNLTSTLYAAAVNLWNGGEANYDDPYVLYGFIKASYFGKKLTELSYRAEQEWVVNPQSHSLFRLAPSSGGFTIPPRRWLAKLHNDTVAVKQLDDEMHKWTVKYPSFYGFPAGVYTFGEPENVEKGFAALSLAYDFCRNTPNIFCEDNARAPYNQISFFIYAADYYLRTGDLGNAGAHLTYRYAPYFNFSLWTLGQDAWYQREANFNTIAQLYQNDNPKDDPKNAFIKRHKWGPDSSTCQLCHQAQGATFTEEQKNEIHYLPVSERYVRDWPSSQVGWYGAIKSL